MAKRGAPLGNNNGGKTKIWRQAIERQIAKRPKDLEEAAMALVEAAKAGDIGALKELGDRLEGKATQGITITPDSTMTIVHRSE